MHRFSRRSLIAAASIPLGPWFLHVRDSTAQTPLESPNVALGQGLEVRDYRLFPTTDVKRFIVEIVNTTDSPIDTPTVGLILPQVPPDEGFGVASPVTPVLYPHASSVLFGVAPQGVKDDSVWRNAKWMMCDKVDATGWEIIARLEIDLDYEYVVQSSTVAYVSIDVTNRGDKPTNDFMLCGDIVDGEGRVCGVTIPWMAGLLAGGQTQRVYRGIGSKMNHYGDALTLVDSVEELSVRVSVQPRVRLLPSSCPVVMPWNR